VLLELQGLLNSYQQRLATNQKKNAQA
jgi:hypothetical protein